MMGFTREAKICSYKNTHVNIYNIFLHKDPKLQASQNVFELMYPKTAPFMLWNMTQHRKGIS